MNSHQQTLNGIHATIGKKGRKRAFRSYVRHLYDRLDEIDAVALAVLDDPDPGRLNLDDDIWRAGPELCALAAPIVYQLEERPEDPLPDNNRFYRTVGDVLNEGDWERGTHRETASRLQWLTSAIRRLLDLPPFDPATIQPPNL